MKKRAKFKNLALCLKIFSRLVVKNNSNQQEKRKDFDLLHRIRIYSGKIRDF